MTRMSNEYYQLLEKDLNSLLNEFKDIFEQKYISQVQEFIDVGEYGLALEDICLTVKAEGQSIPKSVEKKIIELAQHMKVGKEYYEGIKVL